MLYSLEMANYINEIIQVWPSTLLVVSHDRHFLNVVPTDVILLRDHTLDCYRGNYDNFSKAMTEKVKNQIREYEAQQQYRAHVQVRRGIISILLASLQ